MVVGIVGKDIEHYPAKHFLAICLWQVEFPTNGQYVFIAVGLGIHSCQGLCVDFT